MTTTPLNLAQLIDRINPQWEQIEAQTISAASKALLRLATFRTLDHMSHTHRSFLLASGIDKDNNWTSLLQSQLTQLRDTAPISHQSLAALLEPQTKINPYPKRHKELPEAFFTHISKTELDRFDRSWERALCEQGIATAGWNLWELKGQLKPQDTHGFQETLETQLFPHGIVLFSKSYGMIEEGDSLIWNGGWLILLESQYRTPRFERLAHHLIPGSAHWKLLFQPKTNTAHSK